VCVCACARACIWILNISTYNVCKSVRQHLFSWRPCELQKSILSDKFNLYLIFTRRSQWPSGLRRGSAATRLLGLRVRIPPMAWMFASCECCVLSGRGLCDGPITRPEESYRLCCVTVCDLETSRMRRLKPASGL
jgi:hypothetical protein